MTKQERKLKSMLNYYEVNLGGKKDEKMHKKALSRFLDNFNQVYDFYTLQEIMKKIKDNRKEEFGDDEDERDDFMLPPKNEEDNTFEKPPI